MSIAAFNVPIDQGPVSLQHFGDTIVVCIQLRHGNWAIFGKVAVSNSDGDSQNAGVKLFAQDASRTLDSSDVRIPGGGIQSVSVEGTLTVDKDTDFVHISCATFNGHAQEAQLIAISVDTLFPSHAK